MKKEKPIGMFIFYTLFAVICVIAAFTLTKDHDHCSTCKLYLVKGQQIDKKLDKLINKMRVEKVSEDEWHDLNHQFDSLDKLAIQYIDSAKKYYELCTGKEYSSR